MASGIGLARSSDGLTFQKEPTPVLSREATVAWETTAPSSPSVARFPDGTFHMLYQAGTSIGEATSADGVHWARVDGDPATPAVDPVLEPALAVSHEALAPGEKPPFDTLRVGDPLLVPRVTPAGRLQVRVLYTGFSRAGDAGDEATAIGFAGRYEEPSAGARLERQPLPVYSVGQGERAPALLEWQGQALLFVAQVRRVDSTNSDVGIAGAFSPADHVLDTPTAFAGAP
jgi:hypothetical protein